MAKKLFITATNTDIGKTYASVKILHKLGNAGIKIGAVKPIETAVDNIPQDANKLLTIVKQHNKNFKNLTPFDITAYTFRLPAAPYSADLQSKIKIDNILQKIKEIEKLCDFLLIEGAGGLMVPITKDYFMIDLIKDTNSKALLVTSDKLGCINDCLLSQKALYNANIEYDWCVNLWQDQKNFNKTTAPFYKEYFKKWQSLDEYVESLVW